MDKPLAFLKVIGAGVTAAFSYIFGGADSLLCILMVFITLDYVTGVIVGIINKKLSSEVGFKGLLKKTGILVIVAVAHLIGRLVCFDIRTWVIGYYIANEGISILENAGRMGAKYPKKLLDVLEQLQEDGEGGCKG